MKNQTEKIVKNELSENDERYFEIDGDGFVKVEDDGLVPLVKPGDFLCVEKTQNVEDGDFVFLLYLDTPYCGFWWDYDHGHALQFMNPKFEPLVFDSTNMKGVKILGRVTAVYHPIVNEYKLGYEKFLADHDIADDGTDDV